MVFHELRFTQGAQIAEIVLLIFLFKALISRDHDRELSEQRLQQFYPAAGFDEIQDVLPASSECRFIIDAQQGLFRFHKVLVIDGAVEAGQIQEAILWKLLQPLLNQGPVPWKVFTVQIAFALFRSHQLRHIDRNQPIAPIEIGKRGDDLSAPGHLDIPFRHPDGQILETRVIGNEGQQRVIKSLAAYRVHLKPGSLDKPVLFHVTGQL